MSAYADGDSRIVSWSGEWDANTGTLSDGVAVPAINFSRDLRPEEYGPGAQDPALLFDRPMTFSAANVIEFDGRISDLTIGPQLDATLTSTLDVFNVERSVKPFGGYLSTVFQWLSATCGFAYDNLHILHNPVISVPGFVGNVWDLWQQILAVHDLQMVLWGRDVILGSAFSQTLDLSDFRVLNTPIRETISRGNPTRYVKFNWYNHRPINYKEVYPPNVLDAPVFQVDANELVEQEVELEAWVGRLAPLKFVPWVDPQKGAYDYSHVPDEWPTDMAFPNTFGVYTVAGNDGLPVTEARWNATGGRVQVEMTDDPARAKVIIQGPTDDSLAPYRIAMTSGNYYPALRLVGSGIRFRKEEAQIATGVDPSLTTADSVGSVDSPAIDTFSQGLRKAQREAHRACGLAQELSFDADPAVAVLGSRFRHNDVVWRVSKLGFSESHTTVTALPDTTLGELEDEWSGMTLGDFEDAWVGLNAGDWHLRPLRGA